MMPSDCIPSPWASVTQGDQASDPPGGFGQHRWLVPHSGFLNPWQRGAWQVAFLTEAQGMLLGGIGDFTLTPLALIHSSLPHHFSLSSTFNILSPVLFRDICMHAFLVLGLQPRASCMLSTHSTTPPLHATPPAPVLALDA